jgi:hypothetical protein
VARCSFAQDAMLGCNSEGGIGNFESRAPRGWSTFR